MFEVSVGCVMGVGWGPPVVGDRVFVHAVGTRFYGRYGRVVMLLDSAEARVDLESSGQYAGEVATFEVRHLEPVDLPLVDGLVDFPSGVYADAFKGVTERRLAAEWVAREAEARVWLVGRVRDAIRLAEEAAGYEPIGALHAGEVAVGVFVEFLRDPPVREVGSVGGDGARGVERVRWPK